MGLSPVTHASSQNHGSKVSIVDLLWDEVHVAGRPLHVFNPIAPEPCCVRHFWAGSWRMKDGLSRLRGCLKNAFQPAVAVSLRSIKRMEAR